MKHFTLSIAEGITQQSNNNYYRKQSEIHSLQELLQAVRFDHVAGIFKGNKRSLETFIQADVLMMDCDNERTDNPAEHLTPEKLHEQLQGVLFYAVFSKSHNKQKGELSPRPRFHVYFPLSHIINDAEHIRTLKETLLAVVPEFDKGAKDTARYFNGVPDPQGLVFEGDTCIDTYLAGVYTDLFTAQQEDTRTDDSTGAQRGSDDDDDDEQHSNAHHQQGRSFFEQATDGDGLTGYWDFIGNPEKIIPEGNRHSRLLQIAVGALTNEDKDSALETYKRACRQCRPPHDERDIARIWRDAKEYTKRKMKEQQEQQEQQQHAGRKRKSTPLSIPIIEDYLAKSNITVQFDVIKKAMIVSGFEDNDPALPRGYAGLSDNDKRRQAPALLPLVLTAILRRNHYTFSDKFLTDCLEQLAQMHKYNPVKAMLDTTTWDGQDRITALIKALKLDNSDIHGMAEDWNKSSYYCTCLRKWLHQAIALALNDEGKRKADFVLTLQGKQGIGKTNFFRALAVYPEWFREGATIDTRDKDTIIQATAVWICELGELDATLRKEQSDLKGFLTRSEDTYRRPYARSEETTERRTCFCATVNPQEINRDITGSRRFVYINVDGMDKQFIYQTMTPDWCSQLWRQVYEELYLRNPEGYRMTDEDLRITEENNAPYREPIKSEAELRELIAWDTIGQTNADNEEICEWREYKAVDVKRAYEKTLRPFDARVIGRALKLLCEEYGASYREVKRVKIFRIPKLKNREDEAPATTTTNR